MQNDVFCAQSLAERSKSPVVSASDDEMIIVVDKETTSTHAAEGAARPRRQKAVGRRYDRAAPAIRQVLAEASLSGGPNVTASARVGVSRRTAFHGSLLRIGVFWAPEGEKRSLSSFAAQPPPGSEWSALNPQSCNPSCPLVNRLPAFIIQAPHCSPGHHCPACPIRHRMSIKSYRTARTDAFDEWAAAAAQMAV